MVIGLKAIGELYLGDLIIAGIDQYYHVPNNIWEVIK